jgi:hypothetical protein
MLDYSAWVLGTILRDANRSARPRAIVAADVHLTSAPPREYFLHSASGLLTTDRASRMITGDVTYR